ncbi:response regulator [Bizionia saleffrena]|uniref:Response regulator n=1 Tax=Bizionia saleffrena TaxID=291189 RepID=A0A8H2LPZ6_9FLAO|nr:response regulator [Bizionia saleffrena]TYB80276.1 response regulator [Bizionia saleffrena]
MKTINLICIIDDDPIFIFTAKKVLRLSDFGGDFLVFNNGEDAFNHLKPLYIDDTEVPDLIFLDLNMPIMDGWQFLDEFIKLKLSKVVTLYIVSSSIDPVDIEKAKEYEKISGFIIKPIDKASLRKITKKFILKK